jgi:DNA repair exonuclease SbcCD ATPase subunit
MAQATFHLALPDQKEQTDLYTRQTDLGGRIRDCDSIKERQDQIAKKVRELDSGHSLNQKLLEIGEKLKKLKAQQKVIAGRQQVVVEAVTYLEAGAPDQVNRCPVCDTEIQNLLATLRGRLENALQGALTEIQKRIADSQVEKDALERASGDYEAQNKALAGLVQERKELSRKVGELLGKELTEKDDPVGLLRFEQSVMKRRLDELKELIGARQERLTQIENELAKERCVREVLHQAQKTEIIEKIKESEEYRQLEAERDRVAVFVNDIEAIKLAVSDASHEEASQKLKAGRAAIDKNFRQLARNPAVKEVRLDLKEDTRSGRNVYNITDNDGQDLSTILSQGDLNALALAIFLGLASAEGSTSPLGFIMLDDPSQSMGPKHKENLVELLDEVCKTRQVLLATMDSEFYTCFDKALTKTKTVYVYDEWTPRDGPRIRRQ